MPALAVLQSLTHLGKDTAQAPSWGGWVWREGCTAEGSKGVPCDKDLVLLTLCACDWICRCSFQGGRETKMAPDRDALGFQIIPTLVHLLQPSGIFLCNNNQLSFFSLSSPSSSSSLPWSPASSHLCSIVASSWLSSPDISFLPLKKIQSMIYLNHIASIVE